MSEEIRPRQRFPSRIGRLSRPLLLLFGVRGDNAYTEIDDALVARFGFYRVQTPVANIARYRIEGPWRWITAIGVRMSIRHGDISFSGTARGGIRLDFRERVTWGRLRLPALYVAPEDIEGLAAALDARGIPGEDVRRQLT